MLDEPAEPKASQAPPIADEAKDLKALRAAVVDAAGVSTGLWFSYLFVLLLDGYPKSSTDCLLMTAFDLRNFIKTCSNW
jgi:hypothetical protein